MASPSTVFTEIVTATLRQHDRAYADQMSNHNGLYRRLRERGNWKVTSGGEEIAVNLAYAENSTYQRYSGYETLNVSASDVLSAAKYDWKQAAVHVTASGLELRQNSGKEKMTDLTKARTDVAMKTMANNLSIDGYSDGTADGGKQIGGLQLLVADTGTGTVGGINSTTFPFWQNLVQSAAAPRQGGGAITPSATTIRSLMDPLWIDLNRGMDKPDLLVASTNYYRFYWDSLTTNERYSTASDAQGKSLALKYNESDIIFDSGGGCPASHMYFLNTEYLGMRVHRDANLSTLSEKTAVNQDAVVIPIIFQGNLVCSNRSLQGVLVA